MRFFGARSSKNGNHNKVNPEPETVVLPWVESTEKQPENWYPNYHRQSVSYHNNAPLEVTENEKTPPLSPPKSRFQRFIDYYITRRSSKKPHKPNRTRFRIRNFFRSSAASPPKSPEKEPEPPVAPSWALHAGRKRRRTRRRR
jgi:hypothetical protein